MSLHPVQWLQRFVRFLGVGVIATLVHYAVLVVGVQWLHRDAAASSAVGFTVSAVLNYLLNRRFTFASDSRHRDAAPRFAVIALAGLGLTWALMVLFTRVLGWHYLVSQLISTGVVLLWNFVGNALWTFRARGRAEKARAGD